MVVILVVKTLDIKGDRDVLASRIIQRLPFADGIQTKLRCLRGQMEPPA